MDETEANVTSLVLLDRYRGGEEQAAEEIFARYFARLIALARGLLSARLATRTDPEDIVLSVYRSFFLEARDGRFVLGRGGDLWRLLAAMTRNKSLRQARSHTAGKRSVKAEVRLDQAVEAGNQACWTEPSIEEAAELADELEWVLARLNPFSRQVLELRLQGLQHAEIAAETGRSERSVRRSLAQIRASLAERLEHD